MAFNPDPSAWLDWKTCFMSDLWVGLIVFTRGGLHPGLEGSSGRKLPRLTAL